MKAVPAISAEREPQRAEILPAYSPRSVIAMVDGSRYRPDTTTDAPKPKPVLRGSCANCGKTMNEAYMPAPSRKAAAFVVHTPRRRIIFMSISGSRLRASVRIHRPVTAIPASSRPIVFGEPHPHTLVWLIASNCAESPTVISSAASPSPADAQRGRPRWPRTQPRPPSPPG